MAGITNAELYNTDNESIDACEKIIKRGRKEFNYPKEEVYSIIENEVNTIKDSFDVTVSANLRGTTPDPLIEISKIPNLDIIEINCHCRQEELVAVGCGQSMLLRPDLEDYIKEVVKKSDSKVSMKMRANVEGVDNLEIAKLAEDCGVDYLHIDAMKLGVRDADFDLIQKISNETNIFIIGNNSINSISQAEKMLNAGANGISIARAAISGKLNFDLNLLKI